MRSWMNAPASGVWKTVEDAFDFSALGLDELGKTICPLCRQRVPAFSTRGWQLHFESFLCRHPRTTERAGPPGPRALPSDQG
jgi:hypothetical protein